MEKKVYVELPPFTGRNVPITEIAAAMHKDAQYVRIGLQQGILKFGYAIKLENSNEYNCQIQQLFKEEQNLTALPDSIIQNGLFCCWKYEERNGRKTKVPYQPETGLGAKSNDPSSFVPYKTAVQASGYDGIGIGIFNGVCAIDLDNCVSDSGYYTQTAAEIVALMHSYTEYRSDSIL